MQRAQWSSTTIPRARRTQARPMRNLRSAWYVADQLGLCLYDHIIIGVGGMYYSFADNRHIVHDYSRENP